MAVRTVRVLLTGTVTPYTTAMRAAARTTATTAASIQTSMRAASARATASMTTMARATAAQAARATAAVRGMAARVSADVTRMSVRTSAAVRAALAPIPALAARMGISLRVAAAMGSAALTTMAVRGAAAFTTIRAAALRAATTAVTLGGRWSTGAAIASAAWARAAAMVSASAATARTVGGAAAGWLSSRWAAAGTVASGAWARAGSVITAAMTATRAGAGAAATWIGGRWTAAAAAASGAWVRTSAVVTAATTGMRTAAGTAAGWVAARWAAAATAVGRSFAAMRLAGYAAGASIMGVATGGRRSLEAMRGASLGLVAAFGLAAYAAARFEKSMSEVRAVTGGSAADMRKLEAAALEAGQATIYSATEAAKAEAELARAGISTADIIGGALRGSLDLAASGQLELGEAAIISAQAMNAFKMSGVEVGHIADVISAGAGKSATNVHDMGMAFRQAALLSSQTGLSLEETVGTLSLFAQNALTGSDAGTSLKVMLQRLVPQSKEAASMMDSIGLSAYNSRGEFVGLTALAGQMRESFSRLTPEARNAAMATIFGSDAVRAATVLYEAGAGGVTEWTRAVNDSGYATRVAATMTDNLSGDLERLKGALETALISSGSAANAVLRDMAQALTSVVNWYNSLSPAMQSSVTVAAGLVGVLGLIGAGLLLMLPRIMLVRRELVALGMTAARTRTMMMGLGKVGLIVAGMALVGEGVQYLTRRFGEAPASVAKMTQSMVDFAQKGRAVGEMSRVFGENMDGLGEAVQRIAHPTGMERFNNAMDEIFTLGMADPIKLAEAREQIKAIDEGLAALVASGATEAAATNFRAFAAEAEKGGTSTEKFRTLLPGYTDALATADTQSKLAADGQGELADATSMAADEMQDTRTEAERLADALNTLNGVSISAAQSEIGFRGSLADLTATVKENGQSMDITSEAGRKVKGAFLDAADAAMEHAQAVAEQQGSVEAGNTALEKDIRLLRETMKAAGFGKEAIDQLTASYLQVPDTVSTRMDTNVKTAVGELEGLQQKIKNTKGKSVTLNALTATAEKNLKDLGFKVTHMKDGKVKVDLPTGGTRAAITSIQRWLDAIRSKTVTVTTRHVVVGSGAGARQTGSHGTSLREADGGLVEFYAGGGVRRENHIAQIARGGTWRVWAEDETQGESYIPHARSKWPRSRLIAEETVRRLGGKGVAWNANGSVSGGLTGFTYTPTGASVLGGPGDAMERYNKAFEALQKAWADLNSAITEAKKKADALREAEKNLAKVRKDGGTRKQIEAAREKVEDARAAKRKADARVRQERADVAAAQKATGAGRASRATGPVNLAAYQKQLGDSLAATEKWRKNLTVIGARGGDEVRQMLEQMGEAGYGLVQSLAGASDAQFKDIVAKLKKTGDMAKATLADFTQQLTGVNKQQGQFSADLQQLAAMGYGDLAMALAAQGDATAMQLARGAVTGGARERDAANKAVQNNRATLTGEDLAASLVLLSTLRGGPGRGYAELVAAGLDPGTIRALVPRMLGQIQALPEENKAHFLRQWTQQGGGVAMARGGILTRPTAVLAAEAGDVESWIPVNGSPRSRGLLSATAQLMGYSLTPAARYGAARGGGATSVREGDRHYSVTLNGARQTSAEQARDVVRHMELLT
ncbi:phage tail tape measure protein [Streptomyces zhihengii]|uniref:Phage tail tape measure protein n=1 Tax=Streptomyces zhihengii TaxID=1818004 RepID=A0ABS2UVE6_9ACTN|nr:phage tail tape measure protein [Streptomyces zhihengii]MBM9621033.1 phage tail tape measure protein [Streptomyces zhihengii]